MSAPGVQISSGELKGSRLRVRAGVRPTGQRVREALCSRWQTRLRGASVLDLFAGSGAVGLETASRGAASVLLVDADPQVHKELLAAAERLAPTTVRARRAMLPEQLARLVGATRFDLVFADPPYDFDRWEALLAAADDVLAAGGEAGIEHSRRVEMPARVGRLVQESTRRYGDSALTYYRIDVPSTWGAPRK